jgi:threonine dehydrogenase-like Zn-dependent dehydrogenase
MKALCWRGTNTVRVEKVPDPVIQDPGDAIIRVTSSGICGSDLHLLDGFMAGMQSGDILGHEPMGIVEEVGREVRHLKKGDRVVVPFTISCGSCYFCNKTLYSLCDESNPQAEKAAAVLGHATAGMYGYSHLMGGFAGGQAEYLRVPFADVGPIKIESGLPDEKVVFLSDILPTAWMGAENCNIEPGDTVAIFGCGPVGLLAIRCAWLMGAGRVIAIDRVPERLALAAREGRAETIDFSKVDTYTQLQEMTRGRGPDSCMDAVGCEAHAVGTIARIADQVQSVIMPMDQMHVLHQCITSVRKGGTISVVGAYAGTADKLPFGAFMNKGLTMRTGQTHMQRYMKPLLKRIEAGEIDPSFILTHRVSMDQAAEAYYTFRDKKDGCIKVIIQP